MFCEKFAEDGDIPREYNRSSPGQQPLIFLSVFPQSDYVMLFTIPGIILLSTK